MPNIRADFVDVYPFRRRGDEIEFLLLKRRPEAPIGDTWQAVHGRIEPGETAAAAALRELHEETGLRPIGFWQLDSVHTFFMSSADAIVLAPCFAAEVDPRAEVQLNHEHTAHQWLDRGGTVEALMWPGQRQAVKQACLYVLSPHSAAARFLRLPHQ